jgi:hypothetical protein
VADLGRRLFPARPRRCLNARPDACVGTARAGAGRRLSRPRAAKHHDVRAPPE